MAHTLGFSLKPLNPKPFRVQGYWEAHEGDKSTSGISEGSS